MKTIFLSLIILVGCPKYELIVRPVEDTSTKNAKMIKDIKDSLAPGEELIKVRINEQTLYSAPVQIDQPRIMYSAPIQMDRGYDNYGNSLRAPQYPRLRY